LAETWLGDRHPLRGRSDEALLALCLPLVEHEGLLLL
jgi:hypothetical protein